MSCLDHPRLVPTPVHTVDEVEETGVSGMEVPRNQIVESHARFSGRDTMTSAALKARHGRFCVDIERARLGAFKT